MFSGQLVPPLGQSQWGVSPPSFQQFETLIRNRSLSQCKVSWLVSWLILLFIGPTCPSHPFFPTVFSSPQKAETRNDACAGRRRTRRVARAGRRRTPRVARAAGRWRTTRRGARKRPATTDFPTRAAGDGGRPAPVAGDGGPRPRSVEVTPAARPPLAPGEGRAGRSLHPWRCSSSRPAEPARRARASDGAPAPGRRSPACGGARACGGAPTRVRRKKSMRRVVALCSRAAEEVEEGGGDPA